MPPLAGPGFDVFVFMLLPAGLPALVEEFVGAPFVPPIGAAVEAGAGVGNEVMGVGTSGIGLERTSAISSVTLASVAVLLRYLYSDVSSVTISFFRTASVVKAAARASASI